MTIRPVVPGSLRALGQKMAAARGWTGVQFAVPRQHLDARERLEHDGRKPKRGLRNPASEPWQQDGVGRRRLAYQPRDPDRLGPGYISNAYGNPCSAWAFWQTHNWY